MGVNNRPGFRFGPVKTGFDPIPNLETFNCLFNINTTFCLYKFRDVTNQPKLGFDDVIFVDDVISTRVFQIRSHLSSLK